MIVVICTIYHVYSQLIFLWETPILISNEISDLFNSVYHYMYQDMCSMSSVNLRDKGWRSFFFLYSHPCGGWSNYNSFPSHKAVLYNYSRWNGLLPDRQHSISQTNKKYKGEYNILFSNTSYFWNCHWNSRKYSAEGNEIDSCTIKPW